MVKRANCLIVLTLVFCLGNSALAAFITEITVTQLYGGQSTFDADGGTYGIGLLDTNFSNGAVVKTTLNPAGTFYYTSANTSTSLENDLTSGGALFGDYKGGTWDLQLFFDAAHNNKFLDASGTIDWYDEEEAVPQKVDGRAIVQIDSMQIFGIELMWGGNGITSGYRTTSTSFVDNLVDQNPVNPLEDYDEDFAAMNVTMTIYPDPTGIPEPATMCLLGLGGLALIRNRKRR